MVNFPMSSFTMLEYWRAVVLYNCSSFPSTSFQMFLVYVQLCSCQRRFCAFAPPHWSHLSILIDWSSFRRRKGPNRCATTKLVQVRILVRTEGCLRSNRASKLTPPIPCDVSHPTINWNVVVFFWAPIILQWLRTHLTIQFGEAPSFYTVLSSWIRQNENWQNSKG